MTDATFQPKVYKKNGGDQLVVASGGSVNVETGGQILANGTQAAYIPPIGGSPTPSLDELATRLDSVIAAIQGVGITASS